jgi:hypothetical protein
MFERTMFERTVFEKTVFERTMFERTMFERTVFEKTVFERTMFERTDFEVLFSKLVNKVFNLQTLTIPYIVIVKYMFGTIYKSIHLGFYYRIFSRHNLDHLSLQILRILLSYIDATCF